MNFNFGKEKPLTAEAVENSRIQALVAANDLQVAYENLTDAQKSMDEVRAVMENLNQAVGIIKTYGWTDQTKLLLNADGGLEALLGSVEKLDAKIALEEMTEQKKTIWQKFKEIIIRIFTAIKDFFFKDSDITKVEASKIKQSANAAKSKTFIGTNEIHGAASFESVEKGITVWSTIFVNAINDSAALITKLVEVLENKNATIDSIRDLVKGTMNKVSRLTEPYGFVFDVKEFNGTLKTIVTDKSGNEIMLGLSTIGSNIFPAVFDTTYENAGWSKERWLKCMEGYEQNLLRISSKYQWYSDESKKMQNAAIRLADKLSDSDIQTMTTEDDIKNVSIKTKREMLKSVITIVHSYAVQIHYLELRIRDNISKSLESVEKDCLS